VINGNRLSGVSVMPPMRPPQTTPPATSEQTEATDTTDRGNPRRQSRPKGSAARFKLLNEFIDQTLQQLTPRQVAVWLCLFRDSRNGTATAAQSYIATRCGLQRPTVSTTIGELEALGLVVTIHRGGINRGLSRYRVSAVIGTG
jgi:hypothetical protein